MCLSYAWTSPCQAVAQTKTIAGKDKLIAAIKDLCFAHLTSQEGVARVASANALGLLCQVSPVIGYAQRLKLA